METEKFVAALDAMHPNAVCELQFDTPYQLLVAVMLSAQCTDKRVNTVTKRLFEVAPTPQKMCELSAETLENLIKSCGFYHAKAKNILSASRDLIAVYGGTVPQSVEELVKLAGVGRKTANVVCAVAFGQDTVPVDTHVFRLAHRLGLSEANTPNGVEKDICATFPKETWSHLHHLLIHHGRYTCTARSPKCNTCLLQQYCLYYRR